MRFSGIHRTKEVVGSNYRESCLSNFKILRNSLENVKAIGKVKLTIMN